MEISGSRSLKGSPQAVWDALHNPTTLQQCIPGAEEVTFLDPNTLKVGVNLGIGPFKGHGHVRVQIAEQSAPSHMKLAVNRSGDHNGAQGGLTVDLAPEASGTAVNYGGSVALSGPIAMLDNPVTRPFVNSAVDQFFEKLDRQIG